MKLVNLLFPILFFAFTSKAHYEQTCNHDAQTFAPEFIEVDEDTSALQGMRSLQSITYRNIRIAAHYDLLKVSASSSYATYVQNELVPPVIDYFQAALKVKYPVNGNLKVPTSLTKMCGATIPSFLRSPGVAADIFIFYDSVATNGTIVASTQSCYLSTGSKRPLVGQTVLTRNQLLEAKGDVLRHERNTYTIMHEMIHALGFSSSLYNYFIDDEGNTLRGHIKQRKIGGITYTLIDIPLLTEKVRSYFGCPYLEGAILENNGVSGNTNSHFERQFFLYETMTPSTIDGRRISELSLGFLEASGWYIPDYSFAEPYFYGRGQGCDFVNGVCQTSSYVFDEFCTGTAKGCSGNGRSGGSCSSDSFSNGCKYYAPNKNFDYDCENDAATGAILPDLQSFGRGVGSKCFSGNLNTKTTSTKSTFCFKYKCTGSGTNVKLEVSVGKIKVVCDKESKKTVKGYKGTIDCPDPVVFCSTVGVQYCPRNCLGRGTCVNNKCQCNKGYTGVDCGLKV